VARPWPCRRAPAQRQGRGRGALARCGHPATARAFATAIDKAQALADSDRGAAERILPAYIYISKTTAALVSLNAYPTSLDVVQIQRVADLMAEGGLLKRPLDVAPLLLR
jgi:NitT/TauT family transport system substrate-binding protein